jgi:NodT family efflux transporter outer membrane factor (OMF) lipoprotein
MLLPRPAPPAGAVLCILLSACSLGPDYTPPELEIPAAYRATAESAKEAWPSVDWWRGFGSADLDALITEAEANSFDIAAAVGRVRQADAQVRIAGSALLPTVTASAKDNWNRAFVQRAVGGGHYTEGRLYTLGPAVSYEFDVWGRLRATRDAAVASALFSRFDQQTVAITAVAAVATTWFQALALQDRIDVAHRNLRDSEDILAAIQARQDAGTASLLDVSQQGALVAGIRAQIPGLQSQMEQQLVGLGILTGHPPEAITLRPGTLNTLSLPETPINLPSALLGRRPDIASAEAQLIAANANIRVARADFFPQITLTGSGGWQNVALGTLFGPTSVFANALLTATQTIFDNGQLAGQLEQAKGRYDELLADYRKAVVQAFTDVDDAAIAYRFATEQEKLQADAVKVAQQAADIARAQVLAGTSDIVTALQAQTTLFNDLDTLAQVRLSRFLALVNLYKALGGGWAKSDVVSPAVTIYQGVL